MFWLWDNTRADTININWRGGTVARIQDWDGVGSLVEFAASLNLQRRNLSQSQKAIAAQACLPLLEAEAKARQKLAGESTHSNQYKNVQLVPTPAQPIVTHENSTMLPKNNIKSAKEAGRIMRVMIDRTERLERNSGSNSQRSQVNSAPPIKVQRITGKISRHIYYLNKLGLRSPYTQLWYNHN